jgi:integrase
VIVVDSPPIQAVTVSLSSINLSPRRPAIDAANLPELVEHYVVDSRLRVKPGTAATYDLMLSYLLGWWGEAGPALGYRLDRQGWALFEAWLGRQCSRQSHKPLTFNTRKSCLSRCKQMLRWAYRLGYLDRDFSDQIPQAKGNADLRTPPSLDDLARLMAAAGKSSRPLRDQAIVAVFVGTGIRRAEATALAVSDVQFHADGGGVITVRVAKLDKPRKVAFDRVCGEYIAALLEGEGLIEGRLFRQWKGRDMSPASVYRVVKRACQVAGIDKRGRGPHDLRRAFATEWMRHRRGLADGQLLSMQMGHTSGAMTLSYSGLTFDDLEEDFTSPLSSM